MRQWIFVEPGLCGSSGLAGKARVVLHATLLEEARSPDYCARHTTHLMPIPYSVAGHEADELDRWYAEEHVEMLLRCSDWLRVRRYRVERVSGESWTRLVVHDLAAPDVLERTEVRAAMATPWRQQLARRPWFLAEPRAALGVVATGNSDA